jgi:peptidyl-prolyl cis-trans isomerase SurA
MRVFHTALLGTAALLCVGIAASAQQPAQPQMAAVAPASDLPPSADAPPSADMPASNLPASSLPAGAQPAPAPKIPAPAAMVPASGAAPDKSAPAVKSAALEPKPKVYQPGLVSGGPDASDQDMDGVAASVNDIAVSDYEVRQRLNLFLATSGVAQPSADELKRIRGQILEQLENEKLELQEAIKKHITVAPGEVDTQIDHMLSDSHITMDQMREVLRTAGSSEIALRQQITAQIAWQKTVSSEYGDRIDISPTEVDAELAHYAEGADKPHYQVGEIFFSVDNPDKDAAALKDAQDVERQIKSGGSFPQIAKQFSQSPSAASGGDIGWVHEGQLAPELNAALTKMQVNTVTDPIRSIGGYYILALRARQAPLGTKFDTPIEAPTTASSTLELARLLLPLGVSPSKDTVDQGMKIAASIRNAYTGCDMLKTASDQLPGSVYAKLGDMKVGDLSADMQKALESTHSGEAATPFISAAGIEVIGRCDKKIEVQTAYVLPTKSQVEDQLFQQQISAMARRYMRDLRRGVDVEVR